MAPYNLIQGNKVPQVHLARVSGVLTNSIWHGIPVYQKPEKGLSPYPYFSLVELADFVGEPLIRLQNRMEGKPDGRT